MGSRRTPFPAAGVGIATPGARPSELQLRMTRNILDYICRRGMAAGDHLTEQELVDEFEVSRSPIRGALSCLAELGVVENRPNRGFFVRLDSRELGSPDWDPPRTGEEELRISIANDWLEKRVPRTFSESEFRTRYGLGRLVASRILLKLAEDGIISRNRGHGWQFEPTLNTGPANAESRDFRMLVEPAAILSPSFELDRGFSRTCRHRHETVLKLAPEDASPDTLAGIDAEFHRLIGISSRNRFFLAAIERQSSLRRLVGYGALSSRERLLGICADHLDIIAALENGRPEEAAERMRRHVEMEHDAGGAAVAAEDGEPPNS